MRARETFLADLFSIDARVPRSTPVASTPRHPGRGMLSLAVAVSDAFASPTAPRNLLVVFRARSRHTYGFEPETNYDLPRLELCALAAGCTLNPAELQEEDEDPQAFWAQNVCERTLQQAVGRAILAHGAYCIVASADDAAGAGAAARRELGLLPAAVDVVDLSQPDLRRACRDEMLDAWRAGAAAVGGAAAPALSHGKRTTQPWVLVREGRSGRVHFGWRLAAGPAAGARAPGLATGRSSYTGWLGQYALKDRLGRGPTAMEPEIAFVMANLARVGPKLSPRVGRGSLTVLDPTAGSCGLLLAAAALGATELVGVDCDAAAFQGAAAEFARHGLPTPQLLEGDVLTKRALTKRALGALTKPATYDAILCDPPYGMRAPVLREGKVVAERSSSAEPPDEITGAVLELAEVMLAPGGRLVLFIPARGDDVSLSLEALLEKRLPSAQRPHLRLVHGRKQRFATRRSRRADFHGVPTALMGGGAFVRWLCCLERVDDGATAGETPAFSRTAVSSSPSIGSEPTWNKRHSLL